MKEEKKKVSSNSLVTHSKYFSPSNALNTVEQMEMRDVALLIDNDEKNNMQQFNTLNTQK